MSNDIDGLTALNRDYVASVQNCDVKRFDEILAQDFYCSNPDKSLVDRAAFLKQTAVPVTIKNLKADDVKIRVLGDFAIIHARDQLYDGGRRAGAWALYRLLGEAERKVAGGIGACVRGRTSSRRGRDPYAAPRSGIERSWLPLCHHLPHGYGSRPSPGRRKFMPGSARGIITITRRT